MEIIEYKLDSHNPILICHAISKILESIAKTEAPLFQNEKVKLLLSKCQSENFIVSSTACLGLVTLAETGILSVPSSLSSLISSIGFAKNHSALVTAVNSLLILDLKTKVSEGSYICPYKLDSHPFVILLNQEKEVWRDILNQIQFDINHHQPMVSSNSAQLLRPVFIHILLNPNSNLPETCCQQTWNLLIKSKITNLKMEILQWLSTRDSSTLIETNHRLLELAAVTIEMNHDEFSSALMPIIASFGIKILKQGCDPRPNLDIINVIQKKNNSGSCLTIAILTSGIAECPVIYLTSLIETCKFLFQKRSCSAFVANGLLASLLQWFAYPALLHALNIAKTLIEEILSQKTWNCDTKSLLDNKIFQTLIVSFPDLQFHTQLCNLDFQSEEEILSWLDNLFRSPKNLKQDLKHFLYGLLLQTQNSKVTTSVCDILLQTSDSNFVASQMLPLILYKLTISRTFEESYSLLFIIPKLAIVKENLPIIIHTFETFLNSGKPLKHLAVELYYRAWEKEARLHSFLIKILIDFEKENSELNSRIVCAKVMKEMCQVRPESAAELVPLLSEILNRKGEKQDALASALALKGISILCESGIIDIFSTWKALAPKFENEKRPVVLKSLCEFISKIPSFTPMEEEHSINLLENLLSKLWNLVLYSEDIQVSDLAFKALKSYKFQLQSAKLLPLNFGSVNLDLIQKSETSDYETDLNLDEVPGTYWIHMLENVNPSLLSSAGDLLITYIEDETEFLPKIRGEASSYKSLPNKSIIKAIGQSLMSYETSYNSHKKLVVTELLRIFANKYSNPLPSVKYGFLKKCEFSKLAKEYCFKIVSNQAEVSPSARKILEKHIMVSTDHETSPEELSIFYSNFESICKGTSPHVLQQFLEISLNWMVKKSLLGAKNYLQGFEEAMNSLERTLKDESQPETIKEVIVSILESLYENINENSIFESYLSVILNIPSENLMRITSRDWKKVDFSGLKKAISIRTEWVLKRNDEDCWSVFEDIFQECISKSEMHEFILRTIQRIQTQKRLNKFKFNGILASMNRIQTFLSNLNPETNSESELNFLCDILLISVCSLSGIDSLSKNKELVIESKDVRTRLFPLGILNLVKNSDSKEFIPKIMMWLNYMRCSNAVSILYRETFHNALLSLRNEKYFINAWETFVSDKPSQSV